MRAIGLALSTRSLKFRAELRLYAARHIFEFSFRSRHVSQHCVQAFWSQCDESEHYEQDFRAKPTIHPLVMLWSCATVVVVLAGLSSSVFMADLKPRMPSPIPLPSSGSFFGPNTSKAIPQITNRCMG